MIMMITDENNDDDDNDDDNNENMQVASVDKSSFFCIEIMLEFEDSFLRRTQEPSSMHYYTQIG